MRGIEEQMKPQNVQRYKNNAAKRRKGERKGIDDGADGFFIKRKRAKKLKKM